MTSIETRKAFFGTLVMDHVIGLKQTRCIKNVTLKAAKKHSWVSWYTGKSYMESMHMTSRQPAILVFKTMKRQPCWCTRPDLWELNCLLKCSSCHKSCYCFIIVTASAVVVLMLGALFLLFVLLHSQRIVRRFPQQRLNENNLL